MRTVICRERPGWTWGRACRFTSGNSLYYRSPVRIALVWAAAAGVFAWLAYGLCA